MATRSARKVANILRRAGLDVPPGVYYTAFGYRSRETGLKVEHTCFMVTRMRKSRYSGEEDAGQVDVYVLNETSSAQAKEFADAAQHALAEAGLPVKRIGNLLHVPDEEEATEAPERPSTGLEQARGTLALRELLSAVQRDVDALAREMFKDDLPMAEGFAILLATHADELRAAITSQIKEA